MFIYRSVACPVLSDNFVFCGVCCFPTFLRGPSTVQWSRDCVGCQGSSGQPSQTAVRAESHCPCHSLLWAAVSICTALSMVPAIVCYGLQLAHAQPYPWSCHSLLWAALSTCTALSMVPKGSRGLLSFRVQPGTGWALRLLK